METKYKNLVFRTCLEARWAIFYDALRIPYTYERECTLPDALSRPSHFWLPDQEMLIEIRGSIEDGEVTDPRQFEADATILSERMNGEPIYTFYGRIPLPDSCCTLDYSDNDNESAHMVVSFPDSDDGGFDHFFHWCECPVCGYLDLQFCGRAARNKCGCLDGDKENNCDSFNLVKAYETARQAQVVGAELRASSLAYVYMYKAGPYYKIGRTKNLSRRDKQIQLALPYDIEKVHHICTFDEVKVENYWHKHFFHRRANGEWFLLTEEEVREFTSKKWM